GQRRQGPPGGHQHPGQRQRIATSPSRPRFPTVNRHWLYNGRLAPNPNGSCSPRHTSQFVVRCNQPTRVDVIETSWPAERGCTERFRGKPASINASHQRSTAALAFAVGKEEQMIKRFLPIAGVCGLLSVALA